MSKLRESVQETIRTRALFRRGERILVAVSGGVDSMVLWCILRDLAPAEGWNLCVAHFNHQLRGRASDADEKFVRATAAKFGSRCVIARGDVKARAIKQRVSIEMAARELRHRFLARTARRLNCPVIVTGHHAGDQVELFFLRLLRGAGETGLTGMKMKSVSPVDAEIGLVRPLLEVTKEGLLQFARDHEVQFREDASNASQEILRNRVRLELLPLLRKNYQPALDRTVLRLIDLIGANAETVSLLAEQWLSHPASRQAWRESPVGLQRQVIRLQLHRMKVAVEFDLVESLRQQAGKAISIATNKFVACDATGRISWRAARPAEFSTAERALNLRPRAAVSFSGLQLYWKFTPGGASKLSQRLGNRELFDADRVGNQVRLRHWRPGDRFQPIGMKTAVKLQDWFVNQKIPATRRRELVLATDGNGEIFWIQGLRIGDRFKVSKETRRILEWRWRVG